uniref:Ty3/gypsy retrotransposon protein n=1 Tax=Tanacetum cinerariifolium TaxID=118510 RepID=A0A699H893_TANCI|nr:Ty3/gypsy retrotransposon protein [Tanacetum cinerariifolium]
MPVRMFKTTTLKDTSCLARMQEATLALPKAKPSSQYEVLGCETGFIKQLTQKELEEKRAKGLCFYCDQKYVPGHKCPGQLYSLEVSVDEEDQKDEVCIDTEVRGKCISNNESQRLSQLMQLQEETTGRFDDNFTLKQLLSTYEDVFAMPTALPSPRAHDHTITLLPNTPPVTVRPYRLPPNKKDNLKQMVKELLDAGVIRVSQSPFSSPTVMVKKKDGTWRMCVDYRQFNKFIIKDKFPIPMVEELIDELCGAQVFSKLDLRSSYHQIKIKDGDIYKTTFRTHQGHYEFLVMPFGLTNAPSTFQSLMNQSKCIFLAPKVEYLGHVLSAQGLANDPLKIQAMALWPIPKTLKQLRGFLRLTGYYRMFIKNYSIISQPLTKLLKKNEFHWSTKAEVAFNQLKQAMMSSPVLALPNFKKEFVVETDASGSGLPSSQGKTVIFVVVDRLSKYAHFMALLKFSWTLSSSFMDCLILLSVTEIRCLECYLRCITGDKPKEFYGQPPPTYVPYKSEDSPVESVDRSLQAREQTIQQLKFHLQRSQDRMRNLANKHRTYRQFEVGMWVYVKLQPHRHVTLRKSAYMEASRVLQAVDSEGLLLKTPTAILYRRLGKVRNSPVMYVLVQWIGESVEDAT